MVAARSGAEQEPCPALAELFHLHYRALFRLAALLTGDTGTAQTVVLNAFAALARPGEGGCGDGLPWLRSLVVTRSRRLMRQRGAAGRGQPVPAGTAGDEPNAARFESAAVVAALQALPAGQREAIVLSLYLDLTDEQAAAAMRVSPATVRHFLAAARTRLRTLLPGPA
jgi:DNA-directed RNA polymerase specialized sigma24 family protein